MDEVNCLFHRTIVPFVRDSLFNIHDISYRAKK